MEDFFKKLSIYGSIAKEEGQKIAQNALNKGREIAVEAPAKKAARHSLRAHSAGKQPH